MARNADTDTSAEAYPSRLGRRTLLKTATVAAVGSSLMTPVAGQSDGIEVSLTPAETTVTAGETTTFDVVVDAATNGISAYDITITVSDSSVASITAADETRTSGAGGVTIASDGSDVRFERTLLDDPFAPADTITIGSIDVGTTSEVETETTAGIEPSEPDVAIADETGTEYDLAAVQAADLTVEPTPAGPFTISGLTPTETTTGPGDDIELTADVTNDGDGTGTTDVAARLDGTTQQTETVELEAGATTTVQVTLTAPTDEGEYTYRLSTPDDEQSGTLTVEPPAGAGEVTATLQPATATTIAGGTADIELVIEGPDAGIGSYDVTVTVADPATGTITDITEAQTGGTGSTEILDSGASATAERALLSDTFSPADEVSVVTFTLTGEAAGTTELTIENIGVGNEEGSEYTVSGTEPATIEVLEGIDITGDGTPATDPDGDGKLEDINGDGESDVLDVQAFFENLDSEAAQNNPAAFDFNGDGDVSILDVQALFNQ